MSAGHSVELDTLFGDYPLDQAFDEMREAGGEVRPQYRALAETLAGLPAEELQRRKQSADLAFLTTCCRAWSRRPSGIALSAGSPSASPR